MTEEKSAAPRTAGVRLRQWFFPPRVEMSPALRSVLEIVYPKLDLDRISFHHGLPHLFHLLGSGGLALPATWSRGRSRLYFARGQFRPGKPAGLSLILHECFHALQMQQLSSARGWGLFDPFLGLFVACSAGVGFRYHRHPMEHDVYAYFGRLGSLKGRFEREIDHDQIPWEALDDPTTPLTGDQVEALEVLLAPVVCPDCGIETWSRFAESIPFGGWKGAGWMRRGWTLLFAIVWAPLWIVVTALIALLAVKAEIVGWILTGGSRPHPSTDSRAAQDG